MKKIAQIGFGIVFILAGLIVLAQALGMLSAHGGFVRLEVAKGVLATLGGILVILGAAVGGVLRRIF